MPPGLRCSQSAAQGVVRSAQTPSFDWVKERSHLFRGAMFGTLLRSDASALSASVPCLNGPMAPHVCWASKISLIG